MQTRKKKSHEYVTRPITVLECKLLRSVFFYGIVTSWFCLVDAMPLRYYLQILKKNSFGA